MQSYSLIVNPLRPEFFFHSFSGYSMRKALFVYRLIVAEFFKELCSYELFFMIRSNFRIEILAICAILCTLGNKGLMSKIY